MTTSLLALILVMSCLCRNVFATPVTVKEGRLSPSDPNSYARIGEVEVHGKTLCTFSESLDY